MADLDEVARRSESYIMASNAQVTPKDDAGNEETSFGFGAPSTTSSKSASDGATVTTVTDINSYSGTELAQKITDMTSKHGVVVFSKTTCPFCIEVKRTFATLNVPITTFEVNVSKNGGKVQDALKKLTGQSTVPNVFIGGKHIGGCDKTKAMEHSGELHPLIAPYVVRKGGGGAVDGEKGLAGLQPEATNRGLARNPLFWFPNVVNNRVVRCTGVLVFTTCILGIVFREERWAHWMIVLLLLDFLIRLVVGSSLSPLGMLATLLTSPFTPIFKPGPPKQFAAFCGVCFCVPVVALFFLEEYVAGAVVLGMLAGASGLEGFGNFCLGCVFFGLGIRFGLIPPHVYTVYANTKDNVIGAWEWANVKTKGHGPPQEVVHCGNKTKADLKYKRVKTDEHIVSDFHFIRNMQVTYFSMPLSITGLAVAFKLGSPWLQKWVRDTTGAGPGAIESLEIDSEVWQTVALIGAVVYCAMILLYTARLLFFHKKCRKEWHCPMRSPAFGMISITCTLFSFLVYDQDESEHFGRALWWMGSLTHSLLTVAKFGEWVGLQYEMEHIHPSWIILPVGGFVSALVAPIVRVLTIDTADRALALGTTQNLELGSFFYSFAYVMWIVLFAVTFYKVASTHNSDDRIRSQVFIWVAPPAVAAMADFVNCFSRSTAGSVSIGQCSHNFSQLYYISIMLLLALSWAFLPYINFFGRNKFNMSYWNFIFSMDVVAGAAAMHYSIYGFNMSEILFVGALALASICNIIAFFHTCAAIVRKRGVFTPEIKWGPLSFMKLVHEGVRGAIPRMKQCLDKLKADDADLVHEFALEFKKFAVLHHEHATHEDKVVFKEFEEYFPAHAKQWLDDHEEDRVILAGFQKKIDVLLAFSSSSSSSSDGDSDAAADALNELREKIPPFVEHFLVHLDGEEANLNPIGRKHIPLNVQKKLVERVWDITPSTNWAVIIPYVLDNLPRLDQKKKFVKALLWGLGASRAQQIGTMIYHGCDAVMWEVLTEDLPQIIPRGVSGWRRYY